MRKFIGGLAIAAASVLTAPQAFAGGHHHHNNGVPIFVAGAVTGAVITHVLSGPPEPVYEERRVVEHRYYEEEPRRPRVVHIYHEYPERRYCRYHHRYHDHDRDDYDD